MFVNIRETLEKVVEVESICEAMTMYENCEVMLTDEDVKSVEFEEYQP